MPRGMPLIVRFSPKSPTACAGRQRARLHPGRDWIETRERQRERRRDANGKHFFRKPEAGSWRDLKTRARTEIVRRPKFRVRTSSIGRDLISCKRSLSVNACISKYNYIDVTIHDVTSLTYAQRMRRWITGNQRWSIDIFNLYTYLFVFVIIVGSRIY